MKTVCPICGTRKGKRQCMRRNKAAICPPCCAVTRDETCGTCAHYTAAQVYHTARYVSGAPPDGHFIAEINPEVQRSVNKAMEFAQRGRIDAARTAMERLLSEHPANHTVHFGMGVLHAVQGEHREAIRWFDKATATFPCFVEAHFNKALAYQKEFDVANAVRSYRQVVKWGNPNEPRVGNAREFLENMAAAIRQSDGVDLDTYMKSQEAFNQAFEMMEQGDWEQALAGFRRAAARNDRNAPTHGNMGICLARLGRKAEALTELDRAVEINPDYEPAKLNRAAVERMEEGKSMGHVKYARVEFAKEQLRRQFAKPSFLGRLCALFGRKRFVALA